MKSKGIIVLLSILFVGLVTTFAWLNSSSYSCYAPLLKDIGLLTIAFTTLVVTVLLYDRFDFRKKIFDKKLASVLSLLTYLRKTELRVIYHKLDTAETGLGKVRINREELKIPFWKKDSNPNAFVLFHRTETKYFFDEIPSLLTDPFLPLEIVRSLDFLKSNHLDGVGDTPAYTNEFYMIKITSSAGGVEKTDEWCRLENEITFQQLIDGYSKCLNIIEKWINDHSNKNIKLNL